MSYNDVLVWLALTGALYILMSFLGKTGVNRNRALYHSDVHSIVHVGHLDRSVFGSHRCMGFTVRRSPCSGAPYFQRSRMRWH